MTMKFLLEQPTNSTIRTYSLYDIQDRIDYFEKKTSIDEGQVESTLSSSNETLENVLVNSLHQTCLHQESYGSALSRTMMNTSKKINKYRSLSSMNDAKRTHRYSSSIARRVRAYSLTNHSTMAITATTSFSDEPTVESQETASGDYENTYFYPEETTRVDDILSLTTITSNVEKKRLNGQQDVSVCSDTILFQSDTDENSESEQCTMNDKKLPLNHVQ